MRTGPIPVRRDGPFFQNNLKTIRPDLEFLLFIFKTMIAYAKEKNRATKNGLHDCWGFSCFHALHLPKEQLPEK